MLFVHGFRPIFCMGGRSVKGCILLRPGASWIWTAVCASSIVLFMASTIGRLVSLVPCLSHCHSGLTSNVGRDVPYFTRPENACIFYGWSSSMFLLWHRVMQTRRWPQRKGVYKQEPNSLVGAYGVGFCAWLSHGLASPSARAS